MSINIATVITQISTFSDEAIIEELVARGFGEQEPAVGASILAAATKSQGEYSALMINLARGQMTNEVLTQNLTVAFPDAKIGERHGPYYMSHARTGKLDVRYTPTSGLRRKTSTTVNFDLKSLDEEQIVKLHRALAKTSPELAALIKAAAENLPEDEEAQAAK